MSAPDLKLAACLKSPAAATVAVFLMVLTIAFCYGFQYLVATASDSHQFAFYASFSAAFAALLVFVTHSILRNPESHTNQELPPNLGFILMGSSFTLTLYFQSKVIAPIPWFVVAIVALTIAYLCHYRWSTRGSTLAFAAMALAFYGNFAVETRAAVERGQGGDMLLLINAASHEFLHGQQPYHPYPEIYYDHPDVFPHPEAHAAGRVPLGYLPGQWLAYTPFVALGWDLRILNFLAMGAILLIFENALPRSAAKPTILSFTIYPFFLSPALAPILIFGHVWPYWVLLLLCSTLLVQERFVPASVALGIALATRQPALFVLAPLAAHVWATKGYRDMLKYGMITFGTFLLLIVPFVIWWQEPVLFFQSTYLTISSFHKTDQVGLAPVLSALGLAPLSTVLQLAILLSATAFVGFVGRTRSRAWFLSFLGVTYLWLVIVSPYAVRYVYYAGFLILIFGLAVILEASSTRRTAPLESGISRAHPAVT